MSASEIVREGPAQRPNVDETTAGLKDFQRATVDYVFRRMWTDEDRTRKFLVADEVGLGKTLIARGVIAKTIDHLWDTVPRINVVYICSNSRIATQNLSHLRTVSGNSVTSASRLTMLPTVMKETGEEKVGFVSLTPGTSFNLRSRGGTQDERALLYWILAQIWGRNTVSATRWFRFFECTASREGFRRRVKEFQTQSIDEDLAATFSKRLRSQRGPNGGMLEEEIFACVDEFNYLRGNPKYELSQRRYALIGALRTQLAHVAVQSLKPNLIILDEFQRFRDLIATDPADRSDASELAEAIFDHPNARVLLLSATPYKMYTLPDEPEGDDHYADFTRTIQAMAGIENAREITHNLRVLRETLMTGGDPELAHAAKRAAEEGLRKVMCRTERLAATPDRDGMLREHVLPDVKVTGDDVRSWRAFDSIASAIDTNDVFEYWRSTPYPLSIMDRGKYEVHKQFHAAIATANPEVRREVEKGDGFLSWDDIAAYRQVDPGNAKMRGLMSDVIDRGAWRLAWLPPTLPYYSLGGAYGEPQLRSFTKRLVFSAWDVVPKAISVMLSYEAERRTVEQMGGTDRAYDDRQISRPLEYRMAGDRPAAMNLFALMYPSVVLAQIGDPLAVARELGSFEKTSRDILHFVQERVQREIDALGIEPSSDSRVDQSWYWAVPMLLDRHHGVSHQREFEERFGLDNTTEDKVTALDSHRRTLVNVDVTQLGRMPDDLAEVLAQVSVAGPAACALRALSRVCGGAPSMEEIEVRHSAFSIARAFRLMLNKPDIVTLLRGGESDEHYWRIALQHSIDGCLQAVLDEYFHGLVESRSLQAQPPDERARVIKEVCQDALGLKTVTNTIDDIAVEPDGTMRSITRRVRLNIAARFGRAIAEDGAEQRESSMRVAFNSPFRPFVLASTSVGQEGLDFHTYSHAVVHWNLPGNPVDLEQREGRVHRYKGHAVRKNVARRHPDAAFHAWVDDPWFAMFLAAADRRAHGESELAPYWVYPDPDGAAIERYVPTMPLSREGQKYRRLLRTVGGYRMVIGQPRQDDLLRYLGQRDIDAGALSIDLQPPQ